uniref:Membrane integral NOTCH2 associated receptor 2 n=1 Tax=Mus musculus TaxID=10090 RepID=I1E4Y1_MOUSE
MKGDMDLSVLPNNNHPDKFLQLDVKSLMRSSTLLQASLARFPGGNYPATQHWQNLVYSQSPVASQRNSVSRREKAANLHYACIPRRQRGRHMYYWGERKNHCYSANQGIWCGEPSPS